ncbi:Uncharacterized protein FKW44_016946 [Caligus rogercresseyi]|uniref:RNA helicase n=1 Tax=Caligus rogercresseyi TaxID=217165 RepID=A0A7T8K1S3_CALRO|nr:Uncharacterized protein FKW44_016946 [Caligus rogercresseyi]
MWIPVLGSSFKMLFKRSLPRYDFFPQEFPSSYMIIMSTSVDDASNGAANQEEKEVPLNAAEKSLLQKVIRRGLVENTNDIEVQRKDPKSPLFSPALLKGVYGMGFNNPSKIQETALPALLADPPQNMIAQSQSGTGKTAAFVLAMLSRVLCLSPTYELALQTGEVATKMSQFSPELTVRYAVRGEEIPRGSTITDHIIIGTPGRPWTGPLSSTDVMIAMQGHQDQSIRIQKNLSPECQMMLFSATYDKDVMNFAENIISSPLIRLKREEETLDNIKQYYVSCETLESKHAAISNIYGVITIGQAMIFCQTRKGASWLAEKLIKEGHSLSIDERIRMLDRFRDGMEKILITTNVMARGIDVEQIALVEKENNGLTGSVQHTWTGYGYFDLLPELETKRNHTSTRPSC